MGEHMHPLSLTLNSHSLLSLCSAEFTIFLYHWRGKCGSRIGATKLLWTSYEYQLQAQRTCIFLQSSLCHPFSSCGASYGSRTWRTGGARTTTWFGFALHSSPRSSVEASFGAWDKNCELQILWSSHINYGARLNVLLCVIISYVRTCIMSSGLMVFELMICLQFQIFRIDYHDGCIVRVDALHMLQQRRYSAGDGEHWTNRPLQREGSWDVLLHTVCIGAGIHVSITYSGFSLSRWCRKC